MLEATIGEDINFEMICGHIYKFKYAFNSCTCIFQSFSDVLFLRHLLAVFSDLNQFFHFLGMSS